MLNSRLVIEHENEPVLGVSILEAEVADISPRGLRLNAVLRRTTPMSSASLNYATITSSPPASEPCTPPQLRHSIH